MALYYNLYNYVSEDRCWHVGQDLKGLNEYGRQCVHIQACGDELELIREQFSNIPISNTRRVVRWDGAMASFIAMNIENRK